MEHPSYFSEAKFHFKYFEQLWVKYLSDPKSNTFSIYEENRYQNWYWQKINTVSRFYGI